MTRTDDAARSAPPGTRPGGAPVARVRSGRFIFRPADGAVHRPAPSASLHGPAAEPPETTLDLLLSRAHPDDRDDLAAALGTGERFCLRLRLRDTAGGTRTVIVLADDPDDTGSVTGRYIDLTAALDAEAKTALDAAMTGYADGRDRVEQAVGMLRLVYGIPAVKARELLEWRARETGLRVPHLAAQLCAAARTELAPAVPPPLRHRVDDLLLDPGTTPGPDFTQS